MSIQLESVITKNENIFSGQIDDELVMVSIDSGSYYVLNSTALRIWELLESPLSISEICDKLIKEYEIDPQACRTEVVKFVKLLEEKQIITVE
ncbi:MAG: PqqD family peptide modification chaperone [Brevefilum sp.]|nr:PqqD family peptide modification chaperone [Brevefilum sp.]